MFDIDQALRALVGCEGSDLHLKVGVVPLARIHGELGPLERRPGRARPPRTPRRPSRDRRRRSLRPSSRPSGEVDFSHEIPGVARFRINAFHQRGGVSIVAARSRTGSARSRSSRCRPWSPRLAEEQRGIVLVTGTTGSGKWTTLAAMIDHINVNRAAHIVTIEDPIEFVHADQRSMISQREVGVDTMSLQARAAPRPAPGPRRDPDRRDARRGDRPDGAVGRRDRPPRALDDPHPRRGRDDQPHARLLPAPPPAAGALDARRHAARRDLAAPGARPPAAGASRSARSCGRPAASTT